MILPDGPPIPGSSPYVATAACEDHGHPTPSRYGRPLRPHARSCQYVKQARPKDDRPDTSGSVSGGPSDAQASPLPAEAPHVAAGHANAAARGLTAGGTARRVRCRPSRRRRGHVGGRMAARAIAAHVGLRRRRAQRSATRTIAEEAGRRECSRGTRASAPRDEMPRSRARGPAAAQRVCWSAFDCGPWGRSAARADAQPQSVRTAVSVRVPSEGLWRWVGALRR